MKGEGPFLSAINADPQNSTTRLVYADWLEERGDSRAELIRILEKLAPLPVFCDRHWELKPRRNELLSKANPKWLKKMGYQVHDQLLLAHGIPDGCKERWRLAYKLLERWYECSLEDVGGHKTEVDKVEKMHQHALPQSLQELTAFSFAQQRRCFASIWILDDRYPAKKLSDLLPSAFGEPYYTGRQWVVLYEDLHMADPPVYELRNEHMSGATPLDRQSPPNGYDTFGSVSEFVLKQIFDSLKGSLGSFFVNVPRNDITPLLHDLDATFPIKVTCNRYQIYESKNLMVQVWPQNPTPTQKVKVDAANPLQRTEIPEFLLKLAERNDLERPSGIFETKKSRNRDR